MSQPVPITPSLHGNTRVRNEINFAEFSDQQVIPVTVHEFANAGADCPIVFVKNAESEQYQAVAMVGLATGESLLVEDDKTWGGTYLPGVLRMGPFRLARTNPEENQLAIALDMDSPLVGESEGELLFAEEGKPSVFLEERQKSIGQYFEHGQVTHAFVAKLVELGLLSQRELNLDLAGTKASINGLYLVDEQKLRELSDEVVLDLFNRGYLQAIYSHLMSLHQTKRLVRMKQARVGKAKAADA
jgi:SapC